MTSLGQRQHGVTDYYPIGERLPGTPYVVVRDLGVPGGAPVLEVVHAGRPLVVRIIRAADAISVTLRDRFVEEARALARLDHPNIVRINEFARLSDGTPYFVTDVWRGATLRQQLGRRLGLSITQIHAVMRGLLQGLEHAHRQHPPILHRALNPENVILVDPPAVPAVRIDNFAFTGGDRSVATSGAPVPRYASPEQIRGETLTPLSDLYSAALIIYECIAGRGPFDHVREVVDSGPAAAAAMANAHLSVAPLPIRVLAPGTPEPIAAALNAALAKDPGMRPRSAYEFLASLGPLEGAPQLDGDATSIDQATQLSVMASTLLSQGVLPDARKSSPPLDNTYVENKPLFRLPLGNENPTLGSDGPYGGIRTASPPRGDASMQGGMQETAALEWSGPAPDAGDGGLRDPLLAGRMSRPRSFAEAEVAARWASPGTGAQPPPAGMTLRPAAPQVPTETNARPSVLPTARRLNALAFVAISLVVVLVAALAIAVTRSGVTRSSQGEGEGRVPAPGASVVPLPPETAP